VVTAKAGEDCVRRGHFSRFAHDKILIQKRDGEPSRSRC
jgi:hypothetical protein